MKKCRSCGSDNRDGAKFCLICGERFSALPPSPAPAASVPASPQATQAELLPVVPALASDPGPGVNGLGVALDEGPAHPVSARSFGEQTATWATNAPAAESPATAPTEEADGPTYCASCGAANLPGDAFCGNCGSAQRPAPTPSSPAPAAGSAIETPGGGDPTPTEPLVLPSQDLPISWTVPSGTSAVLPTYEAGLPTLSEAEPEVAGPGSASEPAPASDVLACPACSTVIRFCPCCGQPLVMGQRRS
jgi:hypothetical protein